MGRAENWVKNNWKKVLKREGIHISEGLQEDVAALIERLKVNSMSEARPKEQRCEASFPDIPEELSVSDSETSRLAMSEFCSEATPSEACYEDHKKQHLFDSSPNDVQFPSDFMGSDGLFDRFEDCMEDNFTAKESGVLNTESEEYDFAASTYERHLASQFMEVDIQKYTIPNHEKSPFSSAQRTII